MSCALGLHEARVASWPCFEEGPNLVVGHQAPLRHRSTMSKAAGELQSAQMSALGRSKDLLDVGPHKL